MIRAFIEGAVELLKRPMFFLPAIIAMAFTIAVLFLSLDSYTNFFYSVFVLGEVPDASLIEVPFYMITSYSYEIAVIALAAFISLLISLYQLYVYALVLAKKNDGVLEAVFSGIAKIPEIGALATFILASAFLYVLVAYILFAASIAIDLIGVIFFLLLLAWFFFGFYLGIRFIFTPVIMAVESKKLKQALLGSWNYSHKRVFPIFVFLLVLSIVTGIIGAFFSLVSEIAANEFFILAVIVLEVGISNAFYNIVFIKYFMLER